MCPRRPSERAFARDGFGCLWVDFSDQSEAHATAAVARGEAVSVSSAHERGGTEPRTTAHLMLRAIAVAARRAIGGRAGIVIPPTVLRPLEHVAQHVVEAKRIRLERADRRRVDIAVITGKDRPSRIAASSALVRHVPIGACACRARVPGPHFVATGARCIFPLRSAWQTV